MLEFGGIFCGLSLRIALIEKEVVFIKGQIITKNDCLIFRLIYFFGYIFKVHFSVGFMIPVYIHEDGKIKNARVKYDLQSEKNILMFYKTQVGSQQLRVKRDFHTLPYVKIGRLCSL